MNTHQPPPSPPHPPWASPDLALLLAGRRAVALALEEDLNLGDITSEHTIPATSTSTAIVEARTRVTIAGLFLADLIFTELTHRFSPPGPTGLPTAPPPSAHPVTITQGHGAIKDGVTVEPGTAILKLRGSSRLLLAGERTLLNFLGRLCGVAGLTRTYTKTIAATGSTARILDTRKTTPGLRMLEKYAVTCGGGFNHRTNLGDGILIKDNHIKACGGITQAVAAARKNAKHIHKIEIEVTTMEELDQALGAGAQVVLLDNMTPEQVKVAVERCRGRAVTEISGGITLDNLAAYGAANPDYISVGAITHSAPCADLSMVFLQDTNEN